MVHGIIGLGFQTTTNKMKTLLDVLYDKKMITHKIFSFILSNDDDTKSKLILGPSNSLIRHLLLNDKQIEHNKLSSSSSKTIIRHNKHKDYEIIWSNVLLEHDIKHILKPSMWLISIHAIHLKTFKKNFRIFNMFKQLYCYSR